jgi:hypothetical protein
MEERQTRSGIIVLFSELIKGYPVDLSNCTALPSIWKATGFDACTKDPEEINKIKRKENNTIFLTITPHSFFPSYYNTDHI